MVAHLRRGRHRQRAARGPQQKKSLGRRSDKRRALFAPVGDQFIERTRFEHSTRQNVRADLGAFLDDADSELAFGRSGELLQTDRCREAGGPGAYHDDIVFHPLAFGSLPAHLPFLGITSTLYRIAAARSRWEHDWDASPCPPTE